MRSLDEKEKYDPAGFRDFIVVGLNTAGGSDIDAIWKFLDSAGSKVDYRRYGEALFDILIAGGLLGKIIRLTAARMYFFILFTFSYFRLLFFSFFLLPQYPEVLLLKMEINYVKQLLVYLKRQMI